MNKEKFFILMRKKTSDNPEVKELTYELVDGYIIDGVGYSQAKVAYSPAGRPMWTAFELDSGMMSFSAPTLKECKATVRTNQERIQEAKKTKSYKDMVYKLEQFKESTK